MDDYTWVVDVIGVVLIYWHGYVEGCSQSKIKAVKRAEIVVSEYKQEVKNLKDKVFRLKCTLIQTILDHHKRNMEEGEGY